MTTDVRERIAKALHEQMPGCTHDDHGADCEALARVAVVAIQGTYVPPPPGSDRDALPADLRRLIAPQMPPYTSTACQTAQACKLSADIFLTMAPELLHWAQREHASCRLTRKQDMQACVCACHTDPKEPTP